jgi:hypothetical protein
VVDLADAPALASFREDRDVNGIAKLMIGGGLLIAAVGVVLLVLSRFTGGGWLPGDIVVERKNFSFYFPVVTSIVVSVVLTVLLNLFFRR